MSRIRFTSLVHLSFLRPKRSALGVLALAAGLASTSMVTGCSFGPREPELPKSSPEDEKFAIETALAGEDRYKKDGFTLPAARGLEDPQETATGPQQEATAPAARLGHAEVHMGDAPPYRELAALQQPPELRTPAAGVVNTTSAWQLQRSIWVGEGYLGQAQFTPDQKGVVTLSTDSGTLYYYEVASGRLIKKYQLSDFKQFDDAAFVVMQELPDRPQVVVVRESGVQVLDLESGKFDVLELVSPANGIKASGRFGLYGTTLRKTQPQSGTLRLQWVDGKVALEADCDNRPDDWALSADGSKLAIVYYPANKVQLLDLKTMSLLLESEPPQWGGSVALSPDGSLMALGGEKLVIIDTSSGATLAEDSSYKNNIDSIAFTPNADALIVSAYDGKVRSYALPNDLSTLHELPRPQLLSHSGSANIYEFGLSRDARWLVTPSGDKTIKIWKR